MRPDRRRVAALAVLAALALAGAAACGGDDAGDGESSEGSGDGGAPKCPHGALDDLAASEKPVEITFWHTQLASNEDVLKAIVQRFHAAQDDVRVKLVQSPGERETLAKYKAGFESGDLPDLVELEDTVIQTMIDSHSTVAIQDCGDADDYDLSDFLPQALGFYSTEGVLRAMPWNVSHPILIYNRVAFEAAGLDPDDPPTTTEEIREYSEKIVESGAAAHGISLRTQNWFTEFFYALSGEPYVNNGNGRDERATKALLDTETGLAIWTWWDEMVDSGLALNTGSQDGNFDNLIALGTGDAAMTLDGSPVLGPVYDVLATGQYEGVEIGAGPYPGLTDGGGVPVSDGALWISDRSSPEEQAAAWELVKFLSTPEEQAALAVGTGTIPIRRSVPDVPALRDLWRERPAFRVAYDQLVDSPRNEATAGPVIGDYQGVRDAVRDGLSAMLDAGVPPDRALRQAQEQADAAIAEYNARVGE